MESFATKNIDHKMWNHFSYCHLQQQVCRDSLKKKINWEESHMVDLVSLLKIDEKSLGE